MKRGEHTSLFSPTACGEEPADAHDDLFLEAPLPQFNEPGATFSPDISLQDVNARLSPRCLAGKQGP